MQNETYCNILYKISYFKVVHKSGMKKSYENLSWNSMTPSMNRKQEYQPLPHCDLCED
jgi:hypothetical protein